MPRRWQYPVGFNLPVGVPGTEGLKLASFSMLRTWREGLNLVGACISVRKQEILGLGWDIVPTEMAEKSMKNDRAAHEDFHARRMEALAFFKRPDPNYTGFQSWLSALLEDLFVTDAIALYLHPTRLPGRGPFGSDIAALDLIDGTTIKPLVNIRGSIPRPPAPAYQQYLWGVPRSEYMTPDAGNPLIIESDEDGELRPDEEYRADQLLYLPYIRRTWTPYGFPPTEQALLPMIIGLKRQQWVLDWFTEGTIPGLFVTPGPEISTPQQVRQLQDSLNAMAGDRAWAHRIVVLPGGSQAREQKPPELASQADEMILQNLCMAFDVMPFELGVTPRVSNSQSSGAQNQMAKASSDINHRKATRPLLQWLKTTIFDYMLQNVFGQVDMQWVWDGMEPPADEKLLAEIDARLINTGMASIDERRVARGLNPWGLPETSTPFVMAAGAPKWLEGAKSAQDAGVELAQQAARNGGMFSGGDEDGDGGGDQGDEGEGDTGAHRVPDQAPGEEAAKRARARERFAAMRREVEAVNRYVRHGRDIQKFRPVHLSPDEMRRIASELGEYGRGLAIARALKRVTDGESADERERRKAARDAAVAAIAAAVASKLGDLTRQVKQEKISTVSFVDTATDTMQGGYTDAYVTGATDYDPDYELDDEDERNIEKRAQAQHPFLQGLAKDVLAGLAAEELNSRLNTYGATMNAAYEEGFAQAVKDAVEDATIIWHATLDESCCEKCGDRDGEEYTFETLPGYPGDGGFGDLCDGGPNCRCTLEYVTTEG